MATPEPAAHEFHPDQLAFHEAMRKDPDDATVRGVYADWLEEHDQHEPARRLRWHAAMIPHLDGRGDASGGPITPKQKITLPEWAVHLIHQRHFRKVLGSALQGHEVPGHPSRDAALDALPQHELASIGLPVTPQAMPHHYTPAEYWTTVANDSYPTAFRRDVHKADKMVREAAVKLARTKAPAGGQITTGGLKTGGSFAVGGQITARPRRRIRATIIDWLNRKMKLAEPRKAKKPFYRKSKPITGDLSIDDLRLEKPHTELQPDEKKRLPSHPALDDAITKAKDAGARRSADRAASDSVGGDPDVVAATHAPATPEQLRSRLTIRELKDVESSLKLPQPLHLSKTSANKDKLDHEEIAPLSLDGYYNWANAVARHIQRQNLTDTAIERLRDPKHLARGKLAYIVHRLAREAGHAKRIFADTGGAKEWYGNHVAAMTRHLHDSFAHTDPTGELWGKKGGDGRVTGGAAMTLAKMLVAATSGGLKPHMNYDVAHRMIEAGFKHGHGSLNPFKSIPENQGEEHAAWIDGVAKWHADHNTGVTREQITTPGTSLKDRALWYEKVMRPMGTDKDGKEFNSGGTNTKARYSGVKTQYVRANGEHYGHPIAIDKGKAGWKSPYRTASSTPKFKTLDSDNAHEGRLEPPTDSFDHSRALVEKYTGRGETAKEKLPAVGPDGKLQPPGWTSRNGQVLDGRDKINAVISYFTEKHGGEAEGMKAAAKFMLEPQPESAFKEIIEHTHKSDPALAAKLKEATFDNRGFYYEGQDLPGSFLLGPKFGAFTLNLHLDQPDSEHLGKHLTADLWWSRDWNVMLGSLFGPKNDNPKRQETPRGTTDPAKHPERKLMRKAAQRAAEEAGLNNIAELQAVLWYYEQLKPAWFGVDTSSTSYLNGANNVRGRSHGSHYQIDRATGAIHEKKGKVDAPEDDEEEE